MTDWLYDTLIWTGALIALVLVLRRPVAKLFGPQIAYALWALPFLRLILPPIVLPSWMAPPAEVAPATEGAAALDPVMLQILEGAAAAPVEQVQEPMLALDPWMMTAATLTLWLGGAAVFLALRFKGYWAMRDTMLEEAVEVGKSGKIRLIETPAATSPLAFGVFDKVVALPPGFLAMHDRDIRDLAVAHELAHHHGRDLLVNIVMQPLFAMHWFNPLGYYGWQALRRDQEASCDARVVEQRPREKRADYARVIASFAAGPNVALAAPMACPVLGEKSIVERLRSLKMNQPTSRRRTAGRVMLLGALVALPMTATVSYAESQSVEEAFAEEADALPEPPAPPAPPEAPGAPSPDAAPDAPEAPEAPKKKYTYKFVSKDTDGEGPHVLRWNGDGEVEENVFVIKEGEKLSAEEKREIEIKVKRVRREAEEERREAKRERREALLELKESEKERAEIMKEVRIALAEMGDIRAITEAALKDVRIDLENIEGQNTVIEMTCEGDEAATTKTREDGTNVVMICQSKIMAHALEGLKEARAEIAKNAELSDEMRTEVLRSIDQQIENWDS